MIKSKIIVVSISLLVVFIFTWLFPVKRAVKISEIDINKYIHQNKDIIVCHGTNSTDTKFIITENLGIKDCPQHIKCLTGKMPESFMRTQIDDYYDNTSFLLIGNFEGIIKDINESYVFHVDSWYPIEPIKRTSFIMWYPPYGFNIFEKNVSLDKIQK